MLEQTLYIDALSRLTADAQPDISAFGLVVQGALTALALLRDLALHIFDFLFASGPNVPVFVVGAAAAMIFFEVRRPGRRWPAVSGWWARAALLNGIQAGVVYLAGVTWDPWLAEHRPWSADGLGAGWGAVVGYLVITFVYYWWHRWRHQVPVLWRWLHQVHHSPQRLEVITSFYKHPLEILVNSVLSAAILYGLVGLGPMASAWAVLLTGLAELFYHWNVKTPHWLGYLVQRPESHCVHHEHGVHAYNYSDLPLWDMLFGTFHNPRRFESRCGLGDTETRLGEMLIGRDLSADLSSGAVSSGAVSSGNVSSGNVSSNNSVGS